jgi:iron complex transport system substrate-binding protein
MVLGKDQDIMATNQYMANNAWMVLVSPTVADADPSFGAETNIEQLTQSNPQLIITYNGDTSAEMYDNAGLIYYMVGKNATREDVKAEVAALAELLGAQDRSNAYIAWFDEITSMLNEQISGLTEDKIPTVLNIYTFDGNQTFKTTGSGMAQTSDIADGGGINVAAEDVQGFGDVSVEQIAQWDPEYIIYNGTSEEMANFKESFPNLTAVMNDHVYLQPGGVWGWSGISAENILQPLYLAGILHPDLFPDLDIREEVRYFYENFYDFTLTDAQLDALMLNEAPS